jgi:hypothetical protein
MYDRATVIPVPVLARLQVLADCVAYGGTLAIKVHLSELQAQKQKLIFSTDPRTAKGKFEAKSYWRCNWPLLYEL